MHAVIVTRDAYNSLTFQLKFALKFASRSNVTIPHFSKSFAYIFALVPLLLLLAEDNDTNVEIASKNVMPARMLNVYVTKKLTRLKKLCIFTLLTTVFLFSISVRERGGFGSDVTRLYEDFYDFCKVNEMK